MWGIRVRLALNDEFTLNHVGVYAIIIKGYICRKTY